MKERVVTVCRECKPNFDDLIEQRDMALVALDEAKEMLGEARESEKRENQKADQFYSRMVDAYGAVRKLLDLLQYAATPGHMWNGPGPGLETELSRFVALVRELDKACHPASQEGSGTP